MKITSSVNLDLKDANQDPLGYLQGCVGETLIVSSKELIDFLTHPSVYGKLSRFQGEMFGIKLKVEEKQ